VEGRAGLVESLTDPVNDRPPLFFTREMAAVKGQLADSTIIVLSLWCAPCGTFVGDVTSYEVGQRIPGHRPYLVLRTQIPDPSREPVDGVPQFLKPRSLLDDAGDPWLQEMMAYDRAEPPEEFTTHCGVHGPLPFSRRVILGWATEARREILAAEETGDTPKKAKTKRNLTPRAMQ